MSYMIPEDIYNSLSDSKMRTLKYTRKTRLLLWIADKFSDFSDWLQDHCDYEYVKPFSITNMLIEDSQFKLVEPES